MGNHPPIGTGPVYRYFPKYYATLAAITRRASVISYAMSKRPVGFSLDMYEKAFADIRELLEQKSDIWWRNEIDQRDMAAGKIQLKVYNILKHHYGFARVMGCTMDDLRAIPWEMWEQNIPEKHIDQFKNYLNQRIRKIHGGKK